MFILISGFLYAWFLQMILAHFGVQEGYWLCYGMVVLLGAITSDSVYDSFSELKKAIMKHNR